MRQAFRLLGEGFPGKPTPEVLSARERDVLTRFATGKGYAEIAEALGISKVTVRNAIYRIQNKLGVVSQQEIVVWAVRNGLLEE